MKNSYDVIVVGAGPAGSAAAYFLAQAGVDVLLLERHREIGIPLMCAEGVGKEGLIKFFAPEDKWIAASLQGAIFRSDDNRSFKINFKDVGYILERKVFDRDLAAKAAEAGAAVAVGVQARGVENNTLIVRENSQTKKIVFRLLIAADGVESRVGRWFGLNTGLDRTEIHSCAQLLLGNIDTTPDYVEFIVGTDTAPGGYAWIFPKGKNTANVGIGISAHKAVHSPAFYLERYITLRFPAAARLEKMVGAVPAKILKNFSTDRCLLVGDAARVADPISGAGIVNGIHSGFLAARVAAEALKKGNTSKKFLRRYDNLLKKEIVNELQFRKRVRDIYVKLDKNDFKLLMDFGLKTLADKEMTDIDLKAIVFEIIKSSPQLAKLAGRMLIKR
jgi:digeranylgeranylglycerophospholipid reductase